MRKRTGETIELENLMSLTTVWLKKIHLQTVLDEANLVID